MRFAVYAVALFIAGCALPDTSGFVEAEPTEFPYPGTFAGSLSNGILVYQVEADGTGKTCFRDNYNGRFTKGRLKYDGEYFHTEEGSPSVDRLSEDRIQASMSFIELDLKRGGSIPAGCEEFLTSASS